MFIWGTMLISILKCLFVSVLILLLIPMSIYMYVQLFYTYMCVEIGTCIFVFISMFRLELMFVVAFTRIFTYSCLYLWYR